MRADEPRIGEQDPIASTEVASETSMVPRIGFPPPAGVISIAARAVSVF